LPYSAKQLSTIYQITPETIRVWSNTYQDFLSHNATQSTRKRTYTVEDTTVIALVAEQRKQGQSFDEIRIALNNNQRGNPPSLEPEEIKELTVENIDRQLALEVERLNFVISGLQEKLTEAQATAQRVHKVELENAKLVTENKQVKQIKTELKEVRLQAEEKNEQLTRELGEQYNKGFIAGLDHHQQN